MRPAAARLENERARDAADLKIAKARKFQLLGVTQYKGLVVKGFWVGLCKLILQY
jgi:hypothetical protein